MTTLKPDERQDALATLGFKTVLEVSSTEHIILVPVSAIRPNPHQPRRDFPPETIADLAASIKQHTLQQPIVVREIAGAAAAPGGPGAGPAYELVDGERRLRAHQFAGLKEIKTVVRNISDERMLVLALIANLQREDLGILEAADAFCRIRDQYANGKIADAIKLTNVKQATAYVYASIGNLPAPYKAVVKKSDLSFDAARMLASTHDKAQKNLAPARFQAFENEVLADDRKLTFADIRDIHDRFVPSEKSKSSPDSSHKKTSSMDASASPARFWKDDKTAHLEVNVPLDPKGHRPFHRAIKTSIEALLQSIGAKTVHIEF